MARIRYGARNLDELRNREVEATAVKTWANTLVVIYETDPEAVAEDNARAVALMAEGDQTGYAAGGACRREPAATGFEQCGRSAARPSHERHYSREDGRGRAAGGGNVDRGAVIAVERLAVVVPGR